MSQEVSVQEKKGGGFFSSLRGLKKTSSSERDEDEAGVRSPGRSPRLLNNNKDNNKDKDEPSKSKSGMLAKKRPNTSANNMSPSAPVTAATAVSAAAAAATGTVTGTATGSTTTTPSPAPASASLSRKDTAKQPIGFVPDSKQSAEVNAIRRRAWEEEQRLNAAIAAEFVYNPALSEDENMKNQLRWEVDKKKKEACRKRNIVSEKLFFVFFF